MSPRDRRRPETIQALDDSIFRPFGHGRMHDVLVVEGDVIEDVFLLLVHPAQSFPDDQGHFIGKGGIVGENVWHRRGQDMALTIFVLEALAVQCGAASGSPHHETASSRIGKCPDLVAGALKSEH